MTGLVVKKNANLFTIECEGKQVDVLPSGKTKAKGIFVGDYVEFDNSITSVNPRKNILIRPPMANLDKLFIVIAPSPKPDFVLVDKIIIYEGGKVEIIFQFADEFKKIKEIIDFELSESL